MLLPRRRRRRASWASATRLAVPNPKRCALRGVNVLGTYGTVGYSTHSLPTQVIPSHRGPHTVIKREDKATKMR
jgi:hypothetical protein